LHKNNNNYCFLIFTVLHSQALLLSLFAHCLRWGHTTCPQTQGYRKQTLCPTKRIGVPVRDSNSGPQKHVTVVITMPCVFFLNALRYLTQRGITTSRRLLRLLPRPQDAETPSNNTRRTCYLGCHPFKYYPCPTMFFFFFNAFILWNNEAVVHYTWPLTCGIPRPTRTQASRCGTPSLWLLFLTLKSDPRLPSHFLPNNAWLRWSNGYQYMQHLLTAPGVLVICVVTHPSTIWAQRWLTLVIEWVPICLTWQASVETFSTFWPPWRRGCNITTRRIVLNK
jgi:hypothetical protein